MITLITPSGKKVPVVFQWKTKKDGTGQVVLCPINYSNDEQYWRLKFESESDVDELAGCLSDMTNEMTINRLGNDTPVEADIRELSDSTLMKFSRILNKELYRRSGNILTSVPTKKEETRVTEVV